MSLRQDVRDAIEQTAVLLGADALSGWLATRANRTDGRPSTVRDASQPGPADEDGLFSETPEQATERRLVACELHLTDLEERLIDRGVFSDG